MNKFDERLQILRDATSMKQPSRVPYVSNVYTWVAVNSPYTLTELLSDNTKLTEAWCKLQEDYQYDSHIFGTLISNYIKILEPLGGIGRRSINDKNNSVQTLDHSYLEEAELEEFAKNPDIFTWTTLLKRKFPDIASGDPKAKLNESISAFFKFLILGDGETKRRFAEDYGVPMLYGGIPAQLPIDIMYNSFRGIKGTSRDMRKDPMRYKEVLDKYAESVVDPVIKRMNTLEYGPTANAPAETMIGMMAHNTMTVKQFEMFTWPYLSKIVNAVASKGKCIVLYAEGSVSRFVDFYQQFPKNSVILYTENDDLFELRKQLPNICLMGGMPCYKLGNGTKDECVNYAKKLIDGLGRDGGYIFSEDKMVSFTVDARVENMKAVSETVRAYGVK